VIGLSRDEIICVSWKTWENVELVLDAIIERFLSPEEFKAKNPKKFGIL
jgi:translation elongation factor EF-4